MTRISKTVTVPRPIDEVFAYLADFSTTEEWDPGIVSATRVDEGDLGVGSRFDLVSEFKGRRIPLTYEITTYQPPERVVIVGNGKAFTGIDDIRLSAAGDDATTVQWSADFRMKGLGRLFEPFLKGTFDKLAGDALDGLERVMARA